MMSEEINIKAFLEYAVNTPVIDVRSPSEFSNGHIPGAHNIPLFSDEERAIVGTAYTQEGKDDAILKGLEFVGPKMVDFVEKASRLNSEKELLIHCWRGGMRSSSFAWLMKTAGFRTWTLDGGYKTYRKWVLEQFSLPVNLFVIGGETGSGKTDILAAMRKIGAQVIDLEGLAHHRGSAFGAIGMPPQPTVEQFENNLALEWSTLNLDEPVFIEDESAGIGKVIIPESLWRQMKAATVFRLQLPLKERVARLVQDYGQFPRERLEASILRIKKKLGGQNVKKAIEYLYEGKLPEVAEIMLTYYDKAYAYNFVKKKKGKVIELPINNDSRESASKILELCYEKDEQK